MKHVAAVAGKRHLACVQEISPEQAAFIEQAQAGCVAGCVAVCVAFVARNVGDVMKQLQDNGGVAAEGVAS
jgi:hypothetical protein